jgi:hypothetical protein
MITLIRTLPKNLVLKGNKTDDNINQDIGPTTQLGATETTTAANINQDIGPTQFNTKPRTARQIRKSRRRKGDCIKITLTVKRCYNVNWTELDITFLTQKIWTFVKEVAYTFRTEDT